MISLTNISKRYGAQVLFEDVNLRLDPGKRYGIVGANGAGKSTLLRIIIGQESPDSGDVNIPAKLKVGTLNQDHFSFEQNRIRDVVMMGRRELYDAFEEKERILEDPSIPAERLAQLEEVIADNDGYVADSRISEMLEGLGIPTEKHDEPMSVLSGGYKLRVLLAQCLFMEPEILMLDEPTNHLDIFSIKWLEDYLCARRGIVVVISHDREFLNNVCTNVADVDFQTVKIYTGNYDGFLKAKEEEAELRRIENEKAEKRIDDLKNFVDKFKAKASKARQAQSKSKAIERMEKDITDPVYTSRVYPTIKFTAVRPPGKQVLEVKDVEKAFGEKQVLKNVSFDVYRNDKVAIIGPNGVGKSTLLKILMGDLESNGGQIEWGHETYPEYFAQDHHESLDTNTSPYEWLYQFGPGETIGVIRGILGMLLFSGDDVHKSTGSLSGGEAARLVLARMVLKKGNVLILDEPTNHLDMESIEALVEALQVFDGTILLVSHNRYVVERVANKVLEIKPDGIDLFDGSYHEFLEKEGADHLAYQVDLSSSHAQKKDKNKDKKKPRTDGNQKQFRMESKALVAQGKELEAAIETLESDLEAINDLFYDPSYFSKTDPEEIRKQNDRKQSLESTLEEKMEAWEAVNLKIEALKEKHGVA